MPILFYIYYVIVKDCLILNARFLGNFAKAQHVFCARRKMRLSISEYSEPSVWKERAAKTCGFVQIGWQTSPFM